MRLTAEPMGAAEVVAVARRGEPVEVDASVGRSMAPARAVVEAAIASERVVYGLTTGFGALADTRVAPEEATELQYALIRSHAAGLGDPVDDEIVRAMVLLRARTLAAGCSGARPEVVDALAALLDSGVGVAVPEHGSLGASGDLAPMAHVALALTGEGWVLGDRGQPEPAAPHLAAAGLKPLDLQVKDGLALLNATEGMLALLVLAVEDLTMLADTADVVCALSVEALLATDRPFAERLQRLRPHPGQARSAANLRRLLDGSAILASHRDSLHAVQDAYSLRCAPQVHGAVRDTLDWAATVRDRELAACVDNPVVLPEDGAVESTGNFHGEPLGFALDLLAMGAAELGAISERRTDRMLDPARSHGLPPFLAPRAGTNSGYMLAQYTAVSLVAENRRLAVPATTDSLPTSGMQEDHVSLGWSAGLKLRRAIRNLTGILAVEALVAAQGMELRTSAAEQQHDRGQDLRPAPCTARVLARIRGEIPSMPVDRFVAPDLEAARRLVASGALVQAARLRPANTSEVPA
ncbi:MAG: histidine ammonia-lyase [Nitriliruptorales bacterium]|nr:histidine ammonia-lyase [Nitriliruptorales bacterium]